MSQKDYDDNNTGTPPEYLRAEYCTECGRVLPWKYWGYDMFFCTSECKTTFHSKVYEPPRMDNSPGANDHDYVPRWYE